VDDPKAKYFSPFAKRFFLPVVAAIFVMVISAMFSLLSLPLTFIYFARSFLATAALRGPLCSAAVRGWC